MKVNSKQFFSTEACERISDAVREAESKTAGEIVPVLATTSDNYDRGLFLAAIMTTILATLGVLSISFVLWETLPESWEFPPPWAAPVWLFLPVQLIALVAGYRLADHRVGFHRAFIPHALMQLRVKRAAHQAFHQFKVSHTEEATGILIYVSLFERAVVILADRAINEKHDETTWNEVRDLLISGVKGHNAEEGFVNAIQKCGELLGKDFPRQPDDKNELPNTLQLI